MNAAICESLADLRPWLKWADQAPTIEMTVAQAAQARDRCLAGSDFPVWGFRKPGGNFVLASGLHHPDWEVPKFEIGYWCRTADQGQGYVAEAVAALTWVGFVYCGAERLEIRCDARNQHSVRVAERAGYVLEAELQHEQRAPDGCLRNTLIYARLRADYVSPAEPPVVTDPHG